MAQNAKVYADKRRGISYIQLYWKGERYWRGHYDNRIKKMSVDIATRLADAINADIDKKGPAFDPRQWFRTPGYEFQFSRFAESWLSENQFSYAPSERRHTARYCQLFIDHFNDTDIREIRKADIRQALKSLPDHWSPKTTRNALGVLHKILSDAKDDELLDKLPGFPEIEVTEPEVRWISPKWQDKILEAIPDRDRPIFILIATWGVRPGEARALQWDCVDFDQKRICIKRTFSGAGCNYLQEYTKTRRIRYLPLTPQLEAILRPMRGIGGFVFRNRKGRPYTADLSRTWNDARVMGRSAGSHIVPGDETFICNSTFGQAGHCEADPGPYQT